MADGMVTAQNRLIYITIRHKEEGNCARREAQETLKLEMVRNMLKAERASAEILQLLRIKAQQSESQQVTDIPATSPTPAVALATTLMEPEYARKSAFPTVLEAPGQEETTRSVWGREEIT